jgi:hypothetical protein
MVSIKILKNLYDNVFAVPIIFSLYYFKAQRKYSRNYSTLKYFNILALVENVKIIICVIKLNETAIKD